MNLVISIEELQMGLGQGLQELQLYWEMWCGMVTEEVGQEELMIPVVRSWRTRKTILPSKTYAMS